jgi:hypothetical protein
MSLNLLRISEAARNAKGRVHGKLQKLKLLRFNTVVSQFSGQKSGITILDI